MTLKADPRNARRHSDRNKKLIRQSLEQVGAGRSILVDGDGIVRAGNGVFEQAQELGLPVRVVESDGKELIAVQRTDLRGKDAIRAAALDNIVGDSSSYDYDATILAEIAKDDDVIAMLAQEDARLKEIIRGEAKQETQDADELVDKAAELQAKWRVERGDVWQVGKHRVMCGDSTNAADVARLMQSERGFCFSDPPYNVGKDYGEQTNDSKTRDEYRQWSALWFAEAKRVCDAIVFTPGAVNVWMWAEIEKPKWLVIWVKRNQQSRNGAGGWNAYEPILCYGKVKVDYDVFDELMDASEDIAHPVPKTLKAWQKILGDLSKDVPIIYDPFLGSGTTLVACEQTGRIGRGMEIEPKYVAVTLERLSGLGLTPQRVASDG